MATGSQVVADVIPTIDFSPARSGSAAERAALGAALDAAAQTYGFFTLVNHGIPEAVFADVFQAGFGFFALPEEEKLRTHQKRQNRGYIPLFDSYSGDGKPSVLETAAKQANVIQYILVLLADVLDGT